MIIIIISMANNQAALSSSKRNLHINTIRNSLKQIPLLKLQTQRIQLQILKNYCDHSKFTGSSNDRETNSTSSRNDIIESTNLKFLAYNSFLEKYDLLEKLGEGGNACVYKCKHKKNNRFYAVKKFRIEEEHVLELKKSFINIKQFDHPSICHYKALYFDNSQRFAFLVMEYLPYPNLSECRIKSEEQLKLIAKEIIIAMRYIHDHNICHRDIKPENILYDQKSGKIKIIDFGISKKTFLRGVRRDMLTIIGTHVYLAPEVYIGGGYDERIDLWALGVTLYKLIAGYTPFQSEYHSDTISNILKGEVAYDEKIWEKYSAFIKDFVNKLLKEKNRRMTLSQAQKHLWIQGSDKQMHHKINRMLSFSLELNQQFHLQMKNIKLAMSKEEGSDFSTNCFSKKIQQISVKQYDLQDSEEEEDLIQSGAYELKYRKSF